MRWSFCLYLTLARTIDLCSRLEYLAHTHRSARYRFVPALAPEWT